MEAMSRVQNTSILLMLLIVLFISINNDNGALQANQDNSNKNNRSVSIMRTLRHLQASQVNTVLESNSKRLGLQQLLKNWNGIDYLKFMALIEQFQTDMEFVKCVTTARFPNLPFLPKKNA